MPLLTATTPCWRRPPRRRRRRAGVDGRRLTLAPWSTPGFPRHAASGVAAAGSAGDPARDLPGARNPFLYSAGWCEQVSPSRRRRRSEPDARSQVAGATSSTGRGAPGRVPTSASATTGSSPSATSAARAQAARSTPRERLAPGFIDMHSHSDWRLWENRRAESKIRQGVTTEVVGNCGFSPAPARTSSSTSCVGSRSTCPTDALRVGGSATTSAFDAGGLALNVAHLVGHGTLRIAAMGFAAHADAAELTRCSACSRMRWRTALSACRRGSSTRRAPAQRDEIVAVAGAAARRRGFYASHIRGEGATLLDAVGRRSTSARESDLPVQVSHIKAAGQPELGRGCSRSTLALIDAAIASKASTSRPMSIPTRPPAPRSARSCRTGPPGRRHGGHGGAPRRSGDPRAASARRWTAPANGQSLVERHRLGQRS